MIIHIARVIGALYALVILALLFKRNQDGMEIVRWVYAFDVLAFYVAFFFNLLSAPALNTWSAIIALHATIMIDINATLKLFDK